MYPARDQGRARATPSLEGEATVPSANHRRYRRFPLGLPATLRFADERDGRVVQIVDIAAKGLRLLSLERVSGTARRANVRFVLDNQQVCSAGGRVGRINGDGSFTLELDESNASFRSFVASLA
jgi:hypothetical protein